MNFTKYILCSLQSEGLRDGHVREAYAKEDVLGPDGIPVDAAAKVVGWGTSVSREML